MDAKERYALIKLAREQFELGQKLLAQAGCKLVLNTASDAGDIDVVPSGVGFKHIDELDDADQGTARVVENFLEESPLGLDVDSYFGNAVTYFTDIPDWWADVLHEELNDRK